MDRTWRTSMRPRCLRPLQSGGRPFRAHLPRAREGPFAELGVRSGVRISMTRALTATLLIFLSHACLAADDGRISFLEQEVRNLQRQVQALSRQVDELTLRPDRPAARTPSATPRIPAPSVAWIDAAKWRKMRPRDERARGRRVVRHTDVHA